MSQQYISVADLLGDSDAGAERLAEAAAPNDKSYTGQTLRDDWRLYGLDPFANNHSLPLRWLRDKVKVANAEAASYIAPRYGEIRPIYLYGRLFQDTVPAGLKVYIADIARYRIFGGDADSEEARAYRTALAYLKAVAAGKIDLDIESANTPDKRAVARVEAPPRQFDEAGLAGY